MLLGDALGDKARSLERPRRLQKNAGSNVVVVGKWTAIHRQSPTVVNVGEPKLSPIRDVNSLIVEGHAEGIHLALVISPLQDFHSHLLLGLLDQVDDLDDQRADDLPGRRRHPHRKDGVAVVALVDLQNVARTCEEAHADADIRVIFVHGSGAVLPDHGD